MIQDLTPTIILGVILAYFALLMLVSYFTGKNADNAHFFLAGRESPWYVVAFGMIGATLSGVTFISIPGVVGADGVNQDFAYMQMVFGYLLGYIVIATILLPLYYRLRLTSIYAYLGQRFGFYAYKTGAGYFLLSRTIGASFRLFLVAIVLQEFVFGPFGIPFWVTVLVTIVLIWVYTFRGGINTIIWTDTLQTVSMLTAVSLTVITIGQALETDVGGLVEIVSNSEYSQMFFFEGGWSDPNNFFKQFIGGALITIVMTGLDQDMMQKNLSCRNIRDAQKNMITLSIVLIFVIMLFLFLGALLYIYSSQVGLAIPESTDKLYPMIALQHLSPIAGIMFILGLIAAAYSSADSALTSLTTSFCVDFLNFETSDSTEQEKKQQRFIVHIAFSVLLLLIIILFNYLNNDAVINNLFYFASLTYGPLLGLFSFGLMTRLQVRDNLVLPVCIGAPILTALIDQNASRLFNGFEFGFLILLLNGIITFIGLLLISRGRYDEAAESA